MDDNFRLEGAPNFRDLGGYRTIEGRVVRSGRVFRSGHLAALTDADLARLEAAGIRTIVDFRPSNEQEVFGVDRMPPSARLVSIPIGEAGMAPAVQAALGRGEYRSLPDLAVGNRVLVRDHAAQLGEALRLVAAGENHAVVLHCIGGKDRTGVAAALLLSLLGVPWAEVVRDYLRSNERLTGPDSTQRRLLAAATGADPDKSLPPEDVDALRRFFQVESSYLEAARDEIERISGSIEAYARDELGVTDQNVASLQELLLD
jgi:protein-tyrosine phosphatase